jgi:hypothetical protein
MRIKTRRALAGETLTGHYSRQVLHFVKFFTNLDQMTFLSPKSAA